MSEIEDYLAQAELALVSSPVIASYQIIRRWADTDDGYLRVRATLTNGDFLEAAEYFVLHEGAIVTEDYRHQWMDGAREILRNRWNSTPDHPDLNNFPYHVHVSNEETVLPDNPLSLVELLRRIENELEGT